VFVLQAAKMEERSVVSYDGEKNKEERMVNEPRAV